MPSVLWKLLCSMKAKQKIKVSVTDEVMRETEGDKYAKLVEDNKEENKEDWLVEIQVR